VDAAKMLGVDAKTWMWWERDVHLPTGHRQVQLEAFLVETDSLTQWWFGRSAVGKSRQLKPGGPA
jgi:cbb3-type cytochrome oxidase subunit 1